MNLSDLQNKRIAILGLGVEGLSTVNYLFNHGITPTVLDEKLTDKSPAIQTLQQLKIDYVLGINAFAQLSNYDIIFRSPGISSLREELIRFREQGGTITSHTQLFFDLSPAKIIGVTGTKGKGTTASLIYEMLLKEGIDAYLGGNIGQPPMDFMDKLNAHSKVVLELSSFQLMDMTTSPHIVVMLMVTSEHLDYHQDIYEYVEAKRNILRWQNAEDYAVINRDYIASNESDIYTEAKIFYISTESDGSTGCFVKDKEVHMIGLGVDEKVIKTEHILLPGKHNLENVCAAVMAATLAGVKRHNIAYVLKTFKGLQHRLQLVREFEGVKYYDDSFSTTPETAIAAIQSFTQPEVLILGGSSKNSDFIQLGKVIRRAKNIKAIIGVGVEWERIKAQIESGNWGAGDNRPEMLFVEGAKNMHQIVQAACKIAQSGEVVLLSPACASFDMFRNYKERGEEFVQEVNSLS